MDKITKIFRPYDIQGYNSNADWFTSKSYDDKAILQIKDPDGGTPRKDITSIPSPFARMDLVLTAFHEINKSIETRKAKQDLSSEQIKELLTFGEGKRPTMYHRLVSETFDVAEIFYNIEHLRDRFEIIVWDKDEIDKNNSFGRTLKRYLDADDEAYNFNAMQRLYLLNYIGPDRSEQMNIVGATSPVTMFFPTANNLSFVSRHVAFNNIRPFSQEYHPLCNRDFGLIKYLWAFRAAHSEFASRFAELDQYLDYTYSALDNEQRRSLDAIDENSIKLYEKEGDNHRIGVEGEKDNVVEVLGMPLHSKIVETNWKSDFYIQSSLYQGQNIPMVLPVESGNNYAEWRFTTDKWGDSRRAPYKDGTPWLHRKLPDANLNYPYLTISDFLEDTIIRMPNELNDKRFYSGDYSCDLKDEYERDSYLLPLTDTFFSFFTAQELIDNKMITIKENAGGAKVILRIPVKKGIIEYSRLYFKNQQPDISDNYGALVEANFGLGIMPMVRFPEGIAPHYRIAFFDKTKEFNVSIVLYGNASDKELKVHHTIVAPKNLEGYGCGKETYALEHNFDRIKVRMDGSYNYVIPKFIDTSLNETKFTFAIDFGTTNTHIEYCTERNTTPIPFCVNDDEIQLYKLHKTYGHIDILDAFERYIIPETIGETVEDGASRYAFPTRTVYTEKKGNKENPKALCGGNIPFYYLHDVYPQKFVDLYTELKWNGNDTDERNDTRISRYIEELFILLRNKVLINGGDLAATKVIWFHPASMTEGKVNGFQNIWTKAFGKYIGGPADNLINISESKAPVLYFQEAPENVITIDIGGGTTDVFVVERNEDKILLSFRFAGNAIFGDAWDSKPEKNGFLKRYQRYYDSILVNLSSEESLYPTYKQIETLYQSTEIIAFYFSLTGDIVNNNPSLDFQERLSKNDKLRYVFILFYGSIFYYIAKVMKAQKCKKPQAICFSGNGSKTVHVLSSNFETVAKFAKMIFDDVYGDSKGILKVDMEVEPKAATCKGGIKAVVSNADYNYKKDIEKVIVGDNLDSQEKCTLKYKDIDDQIKENVVNSVIAFIQTLFELNAKNNNILVRALNADAQLLSFVKDFCLGEEGQLILWDSIQKGILNKMKHDGIDENTTIEETLFFYPLVGLLHDLALKLSEK